MKATALIPEDSSIIPMTAEESVEFIKDQIATFKRVREDVLRVTRAHEAKVTEFQKRILETGEQIRAQKELLKTEGESPSVAEIRKRLQVESRLRDLEELRVLFDEMLVKLSTVAKEWVLIRNELKELRGAGLSALDRKKLDCLNSLYRDQLREYEFSSYDIADISISEQTYRPSVRGRDLGLTSASDVVRGVWAYLLALHEVSKQFATNHLGFVVFDEPRQQMVQKLSYASFLKRAVKASSGGGQIIFATSEDSEELQEELVGCEVTIRSFEGQIIKKMDPTNESAEE